MIEKLSALLAKYEVCAGCSLTLAGVSALLHGVYFALAFTSVSTGAFLGIVGVINWWRTRRGS